MNWLVSMGLVNAVLATALAAVAFFVGRYSRWPALTHVLWVLVLLKLLTPPLVEIPVGQLRLAGLLPPIDDAPALQQPFVGKPGLSTSVTKRAIFASPEK